MRAVIFKVPDGILQLGVVQKQLHQSCAIDNAVSLGEMSPTRSRARSRPLSSLSMANLKSAKPRMRFESWTRI
jgi:hypothetical protein